MSRFILSVALAVTCLVPNLASAQSFERVNLHVLEQGLTTTWDLTVQKTGAITIRYSDTRSPHTYYAPISGKLDDFELETLRDALAWAKPATLPTDLTPAIPTIQPIPFKLTIDDRSIAGHVGSYRDDYGSRARPLVNRLRTILALRTASGAPTTFKCVVNHDDSLRVVGDPHVRLVQSSALWRNKLRPLVGEVVVLKGHAWKLTNGSHILVASDLLSPVRATATLRVHDVNRVEVLNPKAQGRSIAAPKGLQAAHGPATHALTPRHKVEAHIWLLEGGGVRVDEVAAKVTRRMRIGRKTVQPGGKVWVQGKSRGLVSLREGGSTSKALLNAVTIGQLDPSIPVRTGENVNTAGAIRGIERIGED